MNPSPYNPNPNQTRLPARRRRPGPVSTQPSTSNPRPLIPLPGPGCLHAVAVPAPDNYFTTRLEFPTRKGPWSIREPTIEPVDVPEATRVGAGGCGVVGKSSEGGESSAEDSPRLASSFTGMHVD